MLKWQNWRLLQQPQLSLRRQPDIFSVQKMKLWQKNSELDMEIEKFTVGNDYLLDQKLVKYDCIASIAHARMLAKIGVLSKEELIALEEGLNEIIQFHSKDKFGINQG